MGNDSGNVPPKTNITERGIASQKDRAEKRALALRDNLKRRKQQNTKNDPSKDKEDQA